MMFLFTHKGLFSLLVVRIKKTRKVKTFGFSCDPEMSSFLFVLILSFTVSPVNSIGPASGPAPFISIEGYKKTGIRAICQSSGWYPKPEVLWKDASGKHLSSFFERNIQKDKGLFEVQNEIILTQSSNQNLTCVVRNTLLRKEMETTIHIAMAEK
ncbi:UNVERIFIED_CONTAM: hypothetical protein K2H54_059712 [Gekko kuhli]